MLRLGVSLILALLLWGWVFVREDPLEPRVFAEVVLQEPDLPGDLRVFGELGDVTIEIEGPRSIVANIGRNEIKPRLDLSELQAPGAYSAQVTVDVPEPVKVIRIDPGQISVIVDIPVTRRFDLAIQRPTLVDVTRRIGDVLPQVSEVAVSGPKGRVDQVERVVLPIEIGDRTSSFTSQFKPIAEDAEGQQIPEVTIAPDPIATSVQVEARGRVVPVLIQTFGSPAEGYEVVDRVVNPASVLLDGPDEALAELVSVSTAPVGIESATQTVTRRVGLMGLPRDVRVVEPANAQVDVVIQIRKRGSVQSLAGQPVVVLDVSPGLEAIVDPSTITVVVFAADDTLATLRAGDVTPHVSVAGLGPGVYEVAPVVSLPPEVQWIRTEPETVRIIIQLAAASPPAPTPPPA
jgi:YbbR domain-containing protein